MVHRASNSLQLLKIRILMHTKTKFWLIAPNKQGYTSTHIWILAIRNENNDVDNYTYQPPCFSTRSVFICIYTQTTSFVFAITRHTQHELGLRLYGGPHKLAHVPHKSQKSKPKLENLKKTSPGRARTLFANG